MREVLVLGGIVDYEGRGKRSLFLFGVLFPPWRL